MTRLKKITAGLVAIATMASLSIPAFAESWSINYAFGAPSSVSTQFVRKEYVGLLPDTHVYLSCHVTTGSVKLSTEGFNPNENDTVFYPSSGNLSKTLIEPDYSGCSVTLRANEKRVVADGYINIV